MNCNQAVDDYEQFVGTRGAAIQPAHIEAFEKLTTRELDELFARFVARTDTSAYGATHDRKSRLIVRMLHAIFTGWIWWGWAVASHTIVGALYGTPLMPFGVGTGSDAGPSGLRNYPAEDRDQRERRG